MHSLEFSEIRLKQESKLGRQGHYDATLRKAWLTHSLDEVTVRSTLREKCASILLLVSVLSGKFISDAMKFITDERMDLLARLS